MPGGVVIEGGLLDVEARATKLIRRIRRIRRIERIEQMECIGQGQLSM